MKAVLAGFGEIGKGIFEVFGEYHQIVPNDPEKGQLAAGNDYEILLVAIPFSEKFIEIVSDYQKKFQTKSTLIFSTVTVGTCSQLGAVHSPVEGKHPDLAESIKVSDKWLGGSDEIALKFLQEAKFSVNVLDKPEYTEFMKLRSTTVYGLNIEFARYSKSVCDQLGLDYSEIKKWDKWVNGIYHHFDMDWATRYVLDAPEGPKGGHCVTANAKILQEQFPSELVKIVTES